jgi:hypothetical protein
MDSKYGVSIRLARSTVSLCLDHIIPIANAFVTGVEMNAIHTENNLNAMVKTTINKKLYII